MGRVLSVVWSQAAVALRSMEILSMNDVRPWVDTIKGKPQGYWLVLDLKEMFMSIPPDATATALGYCLEAIASKGQHRNGLLFSISKDSNRKRDCVGLKSREFYNVYTVHDVLHYVSVSLLLDCMFVGASILFHLLTGVPQGGSFSAQLASIYCMWGEARRPSPYCKALLSLQYRDNFLFLVTSKWIICVFSKTRAFRRLVHLKKRGVSMSQFARECLTEVQADPIKFQGMVTEKLISHMCAIYGLGVHFEQAGLTLHFLTSRLTTQDHDWAPIAWKSSIHNAGFKSPTPLSSWLDPWAPNTPQMLMLAVPNAVQESQHFRLNRHAVTSNLSDLVPSLNLKQYPVSWWKNPLVCCSDKWGIRAQLKNVLKQPRTMSLMHYTQSTPKRASTTLNPPVLLDTLPSPAVLSPPPVHNVIFQAAIQKLNRGQPDSAPITKRTQVQPRENGQHCPRDQTCDQIRGHKTQRKASEGTDTDMGMLSNDSTAEPRHRPHSPRMAEPDLSDHAQLFGSQGEPVNPHIPEPDYSDPDLPSESRRLTRDKLAPPPDHGQLQCEPESGGTTDATSDEESVHAVRTTTNVPCGPRVSQLHVDTVNEWWKDEIQLWKLLILGFSAYEGEMYDSMSKWDQWIYRKC